MPRDLSALVCKHIEEMFDEGERDEATALLLQFCQTGGGGQAPDRCEIAALKISDGSLKGLHRAIDMYHIDFRDLLMSAGFGHDASAHDHWTPNTP